MALSSSIRCALFAACATAMLAGCTSGLTPPPAASGAGLDDSLGPSWMDPSAMHRRLLYVSAQTGAVYVYGYDDPTKLVGKLRGFSQPEGECTDKAGDVFITDDLKQRISEYRHAGTQPIATFTESYVNPVGCAVDPKSGKLAVANAYYDDSVSTMGDVAIWTNPSHRPKTYALPYGLPGPPAYDPAGDLLMEGFANPPPAYGLEELPAGASKFKSVKLQGATIGQVGGAMWDGRYFALTVLGNGARLLTGIYRVQVSGSVATVVSAITLGDSCYQKTNQTDVYNPWIQGNVVSGGNYLCKHRFDYWNYATGGKPIRSIPRDIAPAQSNGEAVSE